MDTPPRSLAGWRAPDSLELEQARLAVIEAEAAYDNVYRQLDCELGEATHARRMSLLPLLRSLSFDVDRARNWQKLVEACHPELRVQGPLTLRDYRLAEVHAELRRMTRSMFTGRLWSLDPLHASQEAPR